MQNEYLLIDGKDKIMGRLAAHVAKLALLGHHVLVINAKDIVISGRKQWIFDEYVRKKNIKTLTNPTRGPFFYKRPDKLFRRTARGMLPYKNARGKEAYKRIHVLVNDDVDKNKYKNLKPHEIINVGKERLKGRFITLGTLGERFGWKNYISS
ncbi:MAG: 50S ribosomal protein L13 [Promethearchaeota archaeon]